MSSLTISTEDLNVLVNVHSSEEDPKADTCIANDGYGRRCANKRIPNYLYCKSCWQETRPIGLVKEETL